MLFVAMGAGLIAGMGYLGFAALFAVIMSVIVLACTLLDFGSSRNGGRYKTLQITVPEELDYTHVFEEVLAGYTTRYELVRVKTTNMGSLFRLSYDIILKDPAREKEMIDQLRCRNGNLEISISRQDTTVTEL